MILQTQIDIYSKNANLFGAVNDSHLILILRQNENLIKNFHNYISSIYSYIFEFGYTLYLYMIYLIEIYLF